MSMTKMGGNIFKVATLIALLAAVIYASGRMPVSFLRLVHLAFPPKDLYEPVIYDNFAFNRKNFSKIYKINPKYSDIYEIGILASDCNIPSTYKFKGKIVFTFYHEDKLVLEKISLSKPTVFYCKNDNEKIRSMVLLTVDIPLVRKYKRDLTVKVSVHDADETIDQTKLYMAVSSIP